MEYMICRRGHTHTHTHTYTHTRAHADRTQGTVAPPLPTLPNSQLSYPTLKNTIILPTTNTDTRSKDPPTPTSQTPSIPNPSATGLGSGSAGTSSRRKRDSSLHSMPQTQCRSRIRECSMVCLWLGRSRWRLFRRCCRNRFGRRCLRRGGGGRRGFG